MSNFSLEFEQNRFDMDGHVTGFGNPEWLRTHPPANQTAPAVLTILRGGATCIGRTIMDEMAYRYQEYLTFTLFFPLGFLLFSFLLQLINNHIRHKLCKLGYSGLLFCASHHSIIGLKAMSIPFLSFYFKQTTLQCNWSKHELNQLTFVRFLISS